ncbi:5-formyltetrahydrofolate cyclo-ligase [Flammeovirga pacifica]|uniref:5-formyltetrahydrofolate cyclo-ligase n=1 Tax=Flammeovirga pacifica TaxID=915059 RepID=A0A1S1YZ09_FLAPC|nr:5-formyltetrahydrofolate cyclo-ligase [Flammeovirga pacifica]OHX66238.1 5-formyltetrahydrofolate cyclo-ligase [Flammeovirga pacifica]
MLEEQKKSIRRTLIQKRNQLTENEILISESIISEQFWKEVDELPKVLHTYIPINNEASTMSIIKKALALNWTVVVPQTLKNRQMNHLILHSLEDLEKEKFGTFVPKRKELFEGEIDHILVPGVAFSNSNGRMGYGGGYYDTFLPQYPSAKKWGITYKLQIIDDLPLEKHDIPMDALIIG